jgi:hypothetical protein
MCEHKSGFKGEFANITSSGQFVGDERGSQSTKEGASWHRSSDALLRVSPRVTV